MAKKPWVEIKIALAPAGWTSKMVVLGLKKDPWQKRVSNQPFPLTNPKTRKTRYLSEYVEECIGDIRLGIETTDGVVFVSKFEGTKGGENDYFIPQAILTKEAIREGLISDLNDLPSIPVEWDETLKVGTS
jgi:hypothetical protein